MARLVAALLGLAAASNANGADWLNFATVSMTNPSTARMGAGYLCGNDGKDLVCDAQSTATYLGTGGLAVAGGLTVAGNTSLAMVSTTILQVSSSAIVTCSANSTGGAIRYTSGTGIQFCNGNNTWTTLGTGGGTLTGTGSTTAVAYWSGSTGLTYDTTGFYWDATNDRLGIGLNAPTVSLDVSASGIGEQNLAVFSGGNATVQGSGARIYLSGGNGTSRGVYLAGVNTSGGSNAHSMILATSAAGTPPSERMRIDSAGNVGIGTATPTATLQVSGTFTVSRTGQTTTPSIFVGSNGNVGIKSSNPAKAALEVSSSGAAETTAIFGAGSAGVAMIANWPSIYFNGYYGTGAARSLSQGYMSSFGMSPGDGGVFLSITPQSYSPDSAITSNRIMDWTPSRTVGIGTSTPAVSLSVIGEVQVSNSGVACSANTTGGAIRFVSGTGVQYCNTNNTWTSLSSNTTAGASTFAGLSDTNFTNLANRDYARYDTATNRWVNISESRVMSTTTITSNFPDAITCTDGTYSETYFMTLTGGGSVLYSSPYDGSGSRRYIFYTTAGAYSTSAGAGSTDCVTGAKSIATLYASGQAFNFIGGGASSNALGDRITSGTLAMVANSNTAYISLSTANTDWGYLNATQSYLPRLNAANVSSTYVSASVVQVSGSSLTCNASLAGALRYNGTSNTVQVCASNVWTSLASGTSAGVAALASLTDVQLTNLAGRDYLRFDQPSGKWVNISESTVMSTTTMVPGWPDALVCNVTNPNNGPMIFYLLHAPYTGDGLYRYRAADATNYIEVMFNANGTFNAYTHITATNCGTTIAANYAAGRAFNLIGGGAGTSSNALGDRITSGTLAMVANSSTTYISLSTAGTDWGYLNATQSYLPRLNTANVSATYTSSTYVQIPSATTVLACNSGLAGTMRYTSGTMQVCNGSSWGNVGIGIPTGTIAAFATTTCPNGWTEYTAARGRFLRGIDNGAGIDPSGTRTPSDAQADALQNITGSLGGNNGYSSGAFVEGGYDATWGSSGKGARVPISFDASRVVRTSTETRPSNVAVTYCMYSGYDSQVAAGIANYVPQFTSANTLGNSPIYVSNTDVGIGLSNPTHILHINGQGRATNASWATSSDRRVKEDIRTLTGGLATIEKLRPVTYSYTQQYQAHKDGMGGLRRGFIAQEVEAVLPTAVRRVSETVGNTTLEDFRILSNDDFVPLLVGAVKELKAANDNLAPQLDALRASNAALVRRLDRQAAAIDELTQRLNAATR